MLLKTVNENSTSLTLPGRVLSVVRHTVHGLVAVSSVSSSIGKLSKLQFVFSIYVSLTIKGFYCTHTAERRYNISRCGSFLDATFASADPM